MAPHAPQISLHPVGHAAEPVIVIDNCLPDPQALRHLAAQQRFGAMGRHYPGLRAPLPAAASAAILAPLAGLIAQTFALDGAPGLIEAMFSLVTTPPAALTAIQRLPHFDGLERERLALLIYLGGAEAGGTAFYRHRATGRETIDAAHIAAYDAALHRDVAQHGLPAPAYIAGDTALFEQTAHFAGRANRALIYRGHMLHCADIPPATPLSGDPLAGRLTINMFLMGRSTPPAPGPSGHAAR